MVMLVISLIPKKCSAIFNADGGDVGDVGVVNDDGGDVGHDGDGDDVGDIGVVNDDAGDVGHVGDFVDTQEVQSLQQPHCPPLSPEK